MSEAYKIVIEANKGGGGKKSPIANDNTETKQTQADDSVKKSSVIGYVAYKKYVAPFVSQSIQHQIGTVALRTGNNERQARLQSAYSIGSQIAGIGESIAMGSMMGGGAGAVVGAVIGVTQNVIGLAQKQEILTLNRTIENQTLNMLNTRSGAVNGNRR